MNTAVHCTCEMIRKVNVLPHRTPQHLFLWIGCHTRKSDTIYSTFDQVVRVKEPEQCRNPRYC